MVIRMTPERDKLDIKIEHLKEVLAEVEAIKEEYNRRSDIGWLFSIIANEAGTLAAVTLKKRADQWEHVRHEIEQNLVALNIKKAIKEEADDSCL
jgi:hypothetical protein